MHSSPTGPNLYSSLSHTDRRFILIFFLADSPLIKEPCEEKKEGPGSSLIIYRQSFIFSRSHGRAQDSSPPHFCVSSLSGEFSARLCLLPLLHSQDERRNHAAGSLIMLPGLPAARPLGSIHTEEPGDWLRPLVAPHRVPVVAPHPAFSCPLSLARSRIISVLLRGGGRLQSENGFSLVERSSPRVLKWTCRRVCVRHRTKCKYRTCSSGEITRKHVARLWGDSFHSWIICLLLNEAIVTPYNGVTDILTASRKLLAPLPFK